MNSHHVQFVKIFNLVLLEHLEMYDEVRAYRRRGRDRTKKIIKEQLNSSPAPTLQKNCDGGR